jgi:RHS repeat-associated protein
VSAVGQQATIRRQTPYGTARGTSPAWPNSKGYVGGTADNTGLTHLGAREYDPAIGRFISVDPVFNMDAPEQMNGYAYAANSPVTLSDASGREPGGGSWMYVGSERYTWTKGGYRYYYSTDYYLYCRYGGTQCLGGYGNQTGWINMAYAGAPGVWLVARVVVNIWRVALSFIGPVAGAPRPRVTIPQAATCPAPPVQQPVERKLPKCEFFDFKCLFSGGEGAKAWWRGNRDWVTGISAAVGAGVCIVATAGACAVVGAVGLGIALGGRVADVAVTEEGFTEENTWRMAGGMAIDVGASFIPGARTFKARPGGLPGSRVSRTIDEQFKRWDKSSQAWVWDREAINRAGGMTAAQAGWLAVSAPGPVAPWQFGVPITDPMKW